MDTLDVMFACAWSALEISEAHRVCPSDSQRGTSSSDKIDCLVVLDLQERLATCLLPVCKGSPSSQPGSLGADAQVFFIPIQHPGFRLTHCVVQAAEHPFLVACVHLCFDKVDMWMMPGRFGSGQRRAFDSCSCSSRLGAL